MLSSLVAEFIPHDCHLAVGGLHFHNTPMALVREIIRQRIRIDVLVPPLDGSINADQLIGAGLVREVQVAYLGLEYFGLANRFRAAVERGELRVRDCEEAGFTLAMRAGAAGLPFATLPLGFMPQNDHLPTVLQVNAADYRQVVDPFTNKTATVVRAIAPDVAVIHCQYIDDEGNAGFAGATFLDLDIARAARICLVQADFAVERLPLLCRGVLPAYVIDAYCVIHGGAHPGSSHGSYAHDEAHIAEYAEAARTDAGFARYCTNVIGESEDAYRRAVDIQKRLAALARETP